MEKMSPTSDYYPKAVLRKVLLLLWLAASAAPGFAQVDYSVHFEMEKPQYLLGEPIFCRFVIRNTGGKVFAFRYRTPTRIVGTDYDQEPRFQVTDSRGSRLPDPGPSALRQPARDRRLWVRDAASRADSYRALAAESMGAICRAGPLSRACGAPLGACARPARRSGAFAAKPRPSRWPSMISVCRLSAPRRAQVEAAYQPYLDAVEDPKDPNPAEAVVVLTSLPQPFFLDQLVARWRTPASRTVGTGAMFWMAWRG